MSGERVALRHSHRYLTAAGAERWGEVQVRAISGWDGLPTGFVGVMRDVTDERRAQQHVAAEQGVMRRADGDGEPRGRRARCCSRSSAPSWAGTAPSCGGWATTSACAATPPGPRPSAGLERFMRAGDWLAYEVGDGLPGMAWMSRVPVWKADITDDSGLVRRDEALADGVRSTVALPLRANGVPVGVIVLVSRTPREPESGLDAPARGDRRPGHPVPAAPRGRSARRRAGRRSADAVERRPRARGRERPVRRAQHALPRRARRDELRVGGPARAVRHDALAVSAAVGRGRAADVASSSTRARSPPRRS